VCVLYADGVSTQPLHSHRASAQNTSIHVPTDTAAGRPVWLRLRADTLSQDGLSRTAPRHVANTVLATQNVMLLSLPFFDLGLCLYFIYCV